MRLLRGTHLLPRPLRRHRRLCLPHFRAAAARLRKPRRNRAASAASRRTSALRVTHRECVQRLCRVFANAASSARCAPRALESTAAEECHLMSHGEMRFEMRAIGYSDGCSTGRKRDGAPGGQGSRRRSHGLRALRHINDRHTGCARCARLPRSIHRTLPIRNTRGLPNCQRGRSRCRRRPRYRPAEAESRGAAGARQPLGLCTGRLRVHTQRRLETR